MEKQENGSELDGNRSIKSACFAISVSLSSAIASTFGPLALISPMLVIILSWVESIVTTATTGVSSVRRAKGPCFSSPAANPSA